MAASSPWHPSVASRVVLDPVISVVLQFILLLHTCLHHDVSPVVNKPQNWYISSCKTRTIQQHKIRVPCFRRQGVSMSQRFENMHTQLRCESMAPSALPTS